MVIVHRLIVIILSCIQVSNHYFAHLKIINCYMTIIQTLSLTLNTTKLFKGTCSSYTVTFKADQGLTTVAMRQNGCNF